MSQSRSEQNVLLRCSTRTDVDGTLIHSVGEGANKLHKLAFSHAFKSVSQQLILVLVHHTGRNTNYEPLGVDDKYRFRSNEACERRRTSSHIVSRHMQQVISLLRLHLAYLPAEIIPIIPSM